MSYELIGIGHSYGEHAVLHDVSMRIEAESITVVLGPSGCGKTTLLNIVAGLIAATSGRRSGFADTRFSYAFQEPRLLPWVNALDNLRFALSGLEDRNEAEERCRVFLAAAGLEKAARLYPSELSGGMRQRLSLARAFAYPASFILLDEAFQSVDLRTKLSLMDSFLDLWKTERKTALIVTHDIAEAVHLADQVIVLGGRPATIVDRFDNGQERSSRVFGSESALGIEGRLYSRILAPEA